MRKPHLLAVGFLCAALAAAGCSSHSLSIQMTPNPIVVGLLDKQATIHLHAVAHGFGKVPINSVQLAAFSGSDALIASQTEAIDQNIPATPFGYVIDRDFTVPINGAAVALSGARYITVKVLDPGGGVLAEQRINISINALKGIPLPDILKPSVTPTPSH
jgi:hypothetical protein